MFSFVPRYHVVQSGQWPPPDHAQIFTSMDWGYAAPFDIGWYWTDIDGTIYRAREWYGWNGQPNQGARLSNVEIAQGIRRREEEWGIWGKVAFRIGGRDCFNKTLIPKTGEYGPTYNEDFMSVDGSLGMVQANDKQAAAGIAQCHERLRIEFDENGELVTQPKFKVYSECKHFLRTVPTLICDANNVEVVDDSQEDHCFHAWRNALMSRPLAIGKPKPAKKGPARIIELASRQGNEYDGETFYLDNDEHSEGAAW
jgi:hypothetical protein